MPPRCAPGSGRFHRKSATCKHPCPKLHSKGWRRASKEPYACYRTKPHVIASAQKMIAAEKIRASLRKKVARSVPTPVPTGAMRFLNVLAPFTPASHLALAVVPVAQIEFQEYAGMKAHFGFGERSLQSRFFDKPHLPQRLVGLLYVPGQGVPRALTDRRVVCRLFGEMDRGTLTLWHISASSEHPLNDNRRGTRWGVHNVARDATGFQVRWKTLSGATITPKNARAHVRGSPNPYAVECLVRVAERLACSMVRQHDQIPCAQLFHKDYDHKNDPAIMLLYETLHFKKPLGQYTWLRGNAPPLTDSHAQMLQKMQLGVPVV